MYRTPPPTPLIISGNGKLTACARLVALLLALTSVTAGAENIKVPENTTRTEDIKVDSGSSLENRGTIENNVIEIDGGTFKNYGTINTDKLTLKTPRDGNYFGGTINSTNEIVYQGTSTSEGWSTTFEAILTTKKLKILDSQNNAGTGLGFSESDQLAGVGTIYIESQGYRTGLFLQQREENGVSYSHTVNLNTVAGGQDARIEVEGAEDAQSDAYYYVSQVVSDSYNNSVTNKLQTSNHGNYNVTFEIGDILVNSGFLNIQTEGKPASDANDPDHEGTFVLNTVTLKENTSLRASVYGTVDEDGVFSPTTPTIRIEGKNGSITFNLAAGAGVDFGVYKTADNTDWLPHFVTVAADTITINIEDSNSSNFFYLPKNEAKRPEASNVRVVAASSNNTGNAVADLDKLAGIVQTNYKDDENRANHLECLPDVVLVQEANDLYDAAQGVVVGEEDESGCINCSVGNITTTANPNVNGIAEMTALGLHIWRNEIDDMHRRMGELRDSSAQANGIWTRIYNGRASFGGQDITNKYTAFQFGYDHQISPGLWLGGAISYTYGDNTFDHGDGDSNLLAFTGYASRLYENGIYLDFTGKIGRMKNSFDISVSDMRSSGDYHTNAVSLSAEAGWKLKPIENIFVEPQLEIWYGHVFDAQYQTSTGVDVDQASTDSLVGRAGFRLGIQCPNNRGSAFIKASVLHDWEGEADFRFGKAGLGMRKLTEDLGGTWYEYGIGADFNATNQLHFWAELERGDGGEVDTDYRATIGMRYAW